MPNCVRNLLKFSDKTNEILELLSGENGPVDFNKIVKMPEQLCIDDTSGGEEAALCLAVIGFSDLTKSRYAVDRLKVLSNESVNLGRQYIRNIADTGYKTWYDWSIANWGVKWNAFDISVLGDGVRFVTAWGDVTVLVEKLSSNFPGVIFSYKYADEDIGCNCGFCTVVDGKSEMVEPDGYTIDAYNLSFELWPECRDYYEYNDEKCIFTHKGD